MALSGHREGTLKNPQMPVDPIERLACPELERRGDLVIAAPSGMELAPGVTEFFNQSGLDVHVHIFALVNEGKLPRFDVSLYFRQ